MGRTVTVPAASPLLEALNRTLKLFYKRLINGLRHLSYVPIRLGLLSIAYY